MEPKGKPSRGKPFPPGKSGNDRGRPKGSRNKVTLAAEQLLDGEAEALTRTAIDRAKAGDSTALRLCMERILPPRRDRFVEVDLPPLKSLNDAPEVIAAILSAVAVGQLGIDEATELANLVEVYVRTKQGSVRHDDLKGELSEKNRKREEDWAVRQLCPLPWTNKETIDLLKKRDLKRHSTEAEAGKEHNHI